jgi:hypothetical protein
MFYVRASLAHSFGERENGDYGVIGLLTRHQKLFIVYMDLFLQWVKLRFG